MNSQRLGSHKEEHKLQLKTHDTAVQTFGEKDEKQLCFGPKKLLVPGQKIYPKELKG